MKIEVHIYHHIVRDDLVEALELLASKLRKSSDKLQKAVAANTPTEPSPQPVKGEK